MTPVSSTSLPGSPLNGLCLQYFPPWLTSQWLLPPVFLSPAHLSMASASSTSFIGSPLNGSSIQYFSPWLTSQWLLFLILLSLAHLSMASASSTSLSGSPLNGFCLQYFSPQLHKASWTGSNKYPGCRNHCECIPMSEYLAGLAYLTLSQFAPLSFPSLISLFRL